MNAADGSVRYERRDAVALITLDRPGRLNALNRTLREQLFEALRRFGGDADAAVAVLTGSGRAFCAGADLEELAEAGTKVPPRDFLPRFGENVEVEKPVIAAVNGPAYAGGFLLVQMCDLVVAAESASFGILEARVGRGAPWAVGLRSMVSERVMLELLLTAEPMSAHRAYEAGFANRLVPDEHLLEASLGLAAAIARNAPLTLRASKRMVRMTAEADPLAAERIADELFRPVYESADAQEGPAAFRDGREPVWQGR